MSESVECVVIGAGVVGLAIGRELARAGRETVILESESHIGTATSSRNSEVIHAGIYYEPGSLKSTLCVAGKQMLYDYCLERHIGHEKCGKLIVATTDDQLTTLPKLVSNARRNGVDDLELLSRDEAQALEPELECTGAVLSPSTGIVDTHALMLGLQGDFEAAGGILAVESPVVAGSADSDTIMLSVGGDTEYELGARHVVNAAGLGARSVALAFDGLHDTVPPLFLAKGSYYSFDRRPPFSRLVYPVPESTHLGVHLTLDLGGRARFGPDLVWVDEVDYDVDPVGSEIFYDEIRKYWPALPNDSLSPAYAGIRPKVQGPGDAPRDFVVQGVDTHGVRGLIHLFGFESPGLTACLAIAEYVRHALLR